MRISMLESKRRLFWGGFCFNTGENSRKSTSWPSYVVNLAVSWLLRILILKSKHRSMAFVCEVSLYVCEMSQKSAMGWLRLVGSLKLQVSFAKESYKRDHILQKRPLILRSLLYIASWYSTFGIELICVIFLVCVKTPVEIACCVRNFSFFIFHCSLLIFVFQLSRVRSIPIWLLKQIW